MSEHRSIEEIENYVLQPLEGTVRNTNWGERGVFYNLESTVSKSLISCSSRRRMIKTILPQTLIAGGCTV